jgi:hypothetical protein
MVHQPARLASATPMESPGHSEIAKNVESTFETRFGKTFKKRCSLKNVPKTFLEHPRALQKRFWNVC